MKCDFLESLASIVMAIFFCGLLAMPAAIVGCAEKETILDVETPRGEVEVERDIRTGETDVEVTREPAAP